MPSNSLNLLFWNVRSAICKMSEIIQYYSDFTANIGLLTETWQTSSIPGRYDSFSAKIKELAAAERYSIDCIACPRPSGRRGGGVATLFETHLNVKRYSIRNTYETFESVFTIVKHNKLNFVLGSIYRVPTNISFQSFIEEFTDLLTLRAYEHRPFLKMAYVNPNWHFLSKNCF